MKTMAGTTSEPLEVLQPKEAARNNAAFVDVGLDKDRHPDSLVERRHIFRYAGVSYY